MAKYYPWNRNKNVVKTIELLSTIIVIVNSQRWLSDFPNVPLVYKYKRVIMCDENSEMAKDAITTNEWN